MVTKQAGALALRILVAVCTQTFFQPDEYFQALEPAHHIVFGYGTLTWEWMNPSPVRSIIYPALNVPVYWLLKVSGLHSVPFWGDWLIVRLLRMAPLLLNILIRSWGRESFMAHWLLAPTYGYVN